MNRAWMDCSPGMVEYRVGVLHFLRIAFAGTTHDDMKPCPCRKCINSLNHDWETIYDHLMVNGVLRDYRIWNFHGENPRVRPHDSMSNELEASSKRRKLHSHGQLSLEVMDKLQKMQEKINEMEVRQRQGEAYWHGMIRQIIMQNQQLIHFIYTRQSMTPKTAEGSRPPELLPRQDKPTMGSKVHAEVVDQSYGSTKMLCELLQNLYLVFPSLCLNPIPNPTSKFSSSSQ